jgi:hypothetical protein
MENACVDPSAGLTLVPEQSCFVSSGQLERAAEMVMPEGQHLQFTKSGKFWGDHQRGVGPGVKR